VTRGKWFAVDEMTRIRGVADRGDVSEGPLRRGRIIRMGRLCRTGAYQPGAVSQMPIRRVTLGRLRRSISRAAPGIEFEAQGQENGKRKSACQHHGEDSSFEHG
jgi:hypothetical protein